MSLGGRFADGLALVSLEEALPTVVELEHREGGITVSYEAIRHWCWTFGPQSARTLRRRRGRMRDSWYLDELVVAIQGQRQERWRALGLEEKRARRSRTAVEEQMGRATAMVALSRP